VAAAAGDIAAEEDEEVVEAAVAEAEAGEDTTGVPLTTEEVVAPRIEVATEAEMGGIEVEEEGAEHLIAAVVAAAAAVVGAGEGPPSQGIGSPPTRRSKIPKTSCFRVCHK
jgi:hypothetical protein